ncbi:OLC1v1005704C1 [Oldenlandia corymbosa var. corymbosa]|uniref:OLC1v1005704C1 n=1 Tax=Oldenlandia corymbosa var. corymbosa TaxID=529605 RepID=A0AAV1DF61_OLDCO|nr:OLC1v1005704C1 [Oldenlandia corymbosa var. corymbosa]
MLPYRFQVVCSNAKSNIDEKFRVLRSFGLSDSQIFGMVSTHPYILAKLGPSIWRSVDYLMNELGYNLDFLASHPVFLSLSLEKRVKPRNEVLKILNEKKLNKRKAALYSVLIIPESKFLKNYILPFKDILPDVCETYMSKVEKQKFKSI